MTWRVHDGLPVVEIVNNWACSSFADTYRPPRITEQLAHVFRAVQPDVVHVHNLLNLSFDLTAQARERGAPVVATLHDYTLVCPSGGQRIHRAERHVCRTIDSTRCARCFRESPYQTQIAFTRLAALTKMTGTSGALRAAARRVLKAFPGLATSVARTVRDSPLFPVTPQDVETRLAAARRVFDEVDLFVAPSPSIAAEFAQLGLNPAKIRISDYGFVPLRRVERNGSGRRRLRIGYVGSIVWHKGLHVLLEAVRALPDDAYEVKIFGNAEVFPDYAAALREQAAALPVSFMGTFTRDEAASVYAQIDVLVVPSLWMENSPLVIHEAFMAGVPVVGARAGGIADLLDDGRNGFLYDPASPGALAAALQELITHRGRLAEFARHAPPVKSIADDARDWLRIYADLAAPRRRAVATIS